MSPKGETKPSVAIGIQLQVAVSDGATVMLQSHVDREDGDERVRTLDLLHECAERLFNRYRLTALKSIIMNQESLLAREAEQHADDVAHHKADAERRAGLLNDARTEDAAAWGADNRRGDYKPSAKAVQQVARIEQEQTKANELLAQQTAQTETNRRKITQELALSIAEREQLERLLNGANG